MIGLVTIQCLRNSSVVLSGLQTAIAPISINALTALEALKLVNCVYKVLSNDVLFFNVFHEFVHNFEAIEFSSGIRDVAVARTFV